MQALARRGFAVEVLTGARLDVQGEVISAARLAERGWSFEEGGSPFWSPGNRAVLPPHFRLEVRGVPVTIHRTVASDYRELENAESSEFLGLLDTIMDRFRPDVVVGYGGSPVQGHIFARARVAGARTVFNLHNLFYFSREPFAGIDAVRVPSRFAADYYREALGLDCTVLPNPIDLERIRVEQNNPRHVTFVNPTVEKGAYAFARIADELRQRRPDIPLLVVEARGTEEKLKATGLDLRGCGNIAFMGMTHDPRSFYRASRMLLMPSLEVESFGRVAVEALCNGIPVLASDRGALPETLGGAGLVIRLPDYLTPALRSLPAAEEMAPWVEAIIQLWDDGAFYEEHRHRAWVEARRWHPEMLEPRYVEFFDKVPLGRSPFASRTLGRSKAVVLVSHGDRIEPECEHGLCQLEQAGVRVVRRATGSTDLDVARNALASDAVHEGFETLLFVDPRIGFFPLDALRLLARPEPVLAGIYVEEGHRTLSGIFATGIAEVRFGSAVCGPYPLESTAAGFLRVRAEVLKRMIERLELPLCEIDQGRGFWPFFQPLVVPREDGKASYLEADRAFCHRLRQVGVTPLADPSVRLWRFGRYAYGYEDLTIK